MSTLELENIKHPDNANTNIALASNGSITVDRRSTDGTITEFRKDGTAVGNIATSSGRTSIGSGTNASGVRFDGSGLTPFYNNAVADGTVDLGYSGGRFNNVYLSGGVYLGGLVGANKLDDYEEGTFTPSVSAADSHSIQLGFYTKVGNLVTVTIKIACVISSGGLDVSGLPFVASSASSYYPCGSFFGVIGFENYGDGGIATQIVPNQAVVQLYLQNTSSSSNYVSLNASHVAASANFSINIQYTV